MIEKPKRKPQEYSDVLSGCQRWARLSGLLVVFLLTGCGVVTVLVTVGMVLYFVIATILPPHTVASCEIFFTDTTGFRTRVLAQGFNGETLTYEVTRDSSETWFTLYQSSSSRYPTRPNPDCSTFAVESEIFFWIIPRGGELGHFIVTHDGGVSWHHWIPNKLEEPDGFYCSEIIRVSFQDMSVGRMQLECSRHDGKDRLVEVFDLLTADGGITWEIAND